MMYAVCVELQVKSGQMETFLPLMRNNAAASLREEPGCMQFDVIRDGAEDDLVLLYELYDDADAFQAHLQTEHFKRFDAATESMLAGKRLRMGVLLER